MKKIIALIPARASSKRIAGKNRKDFLGNPLIAYTIQTAKDCELYDEIIVSTDSKTIGELARELNVTYLRRPSEFAEDKSPDWEWIQHALESELCKEPDIIVILRPTNPFRTVRMLTRSMLQFLQSDCDSMRAVEPVKQHPYKMWVWTGSTVNMIPAFVDNGSHTLPTQSLPNFYIQNASLEIIHTKTLENCGNVSGEKVIPWFTDGYEGFDINTPDDWVLAEELVKRGMVELPEVRI